MKSTYDLLANLKSTVDNELYSEVNSLGFYGATAVLFHLVSCPGL
jgi:hypothetical protein